MKKTVFIFGIFLLPLVFACNPKLEKEEETLKSVTAYNDLVTLLMEFRQFRNVPINGGVPDYSLGAMKKQREGLEEFQKRLDAFDTRAWSVSQRVDYQLVRAEMNGLEFQHRVVRPWARDPSFYLITQGGSGPIREGGFGWELDFPVELDQLDDFSAKLKGVPQILEQAKQNLTDGAGDFVTLALQHLYEEVDFFEEMSQELSKHHPALVEDANKAGEAVIAYGTWLEENKQNMSAPAGVGKENYSWLMKNVYLFPYSWNEIRTIVELEDNRVIAFQKLTENKNRDVPRIKPVQSKEEYMSSVRASIDYVIQFLKDEEIFTVEDYMTDEGYYGSWHGFDNPWPEKHDYFFNFSHRESLMEETHEMVGHHFDFLRAERDPNPIRRGEAPYKIGTDRVEGYAFALEELLVYAGYLDERSPRAKEIAYEQAAFRTVRALSDVYMHSQDWTLEDAVNYCVANAPHGELLKDSHHLWYELATTLRGTGHHMIMVVGKVQFMKLIRDRANQLGDDFNLKIFMDEFLESGLIPFALTRWEMTGYDDEMKKLLE
ncbi:DUF885 family protein [Ulvibacterium sp.]|uniref:DUF885 family protein n=1 Tax=Ulvibacterium sp. TaxID=2665914 RepID=UPI002638A7A5|nr:DUF885 family protein [Ulvibacterium sp.]